MQYLILLWIKNRLWRTMCWRPWAINMRWHLWSLPLNSHVGCDHTTGAPSQAFNDTVTCITRPLLQCGGAPPVSPSGSGVGCLAPKAERCSVMWFLIFFFLSSFEVERQKQSGGGGPACLPTLGGGCSVVVPSPAHDCLFLARSGFFSSDMAGAIIENMSTKKLVIVGVTLLLFQAFAFMVGGLIGKFVLFLRFFKFFFFFLLFLCLANICLCARGACWNSNVNVSQR